MIGNSFSSVRGTGKRMARSAGERTSGDICDVIAMPRPAQPDRQARVAVLILLLDISGAHRVWGSGFLTPGPPDRQERHPETLTHAETRVLRYLPTNLSAAEIAGELYLSVNTVKTHQRHLYQKLGARSRTEAVGQARALGLLASSSRMR